MNYTPGMTVLVREYGGRELTRRVVRDLGKTVVICNEREFSAARKERREPEGVGFPCDAVKLPSPR